jgi:hypothetical protein
MFYSLQLSCNWLRKRLPDASVFATSLSAASGSGGPLAENPSRPRVVVDASRVAVLRTQGESWAAISEGLGIGKGTAQTADLPIASAWIPAHTLRPRLQVSVLRSWPDSALPTVLSVVRGRASTDAFPWLSLRAAVATAWRVLSRPEVRAPTSPPLWLW